MATKKKQTKPAVAKPDTAAVDSTAVPVPKRTVPLGQQPTPNVMAPTPAKPDSGGVKPAAPVAPFPYQPGTGEDYPTPSSPLYTSRQFTPTPKPSVEPLTAAAAPAAAPPAAPVAAATPAPAADSVAGQQTQEQPKNQVDRLRLALRTQESSGNYTATTERSSASGAYQFIDSTWLALTNKHGIGKEYPRAKDAPPEIQDKVASLEIADIIANRPEGVSPEDAVANMWFTGNYHGTMSERAKAANPGMDAAQYRAKFRTFLDKTGEVKTALDSPGVGPTSTPADATRTATGLIGAARGMVGSGMTLNDALALVNVPEDVRNELLKKFDPTEKETAELKGLTAEEQKAFDAVYGETGTAKKSPESFIDDAERKDLEKKYPVRQPVNKFAATLSLAMGRMASALTGDQTYYTQAKGTIDKAEAEHQADQERLNQVITTEANRQKLEQLQIDYAMLTRASERLKEKGNLLASREAARRAADIGIETQRLTNAMSMMIQDRQDANKMANAIIEGMMRTGAVYDPKTGGFSKPTPAKDKDDKLITSTDAMKNYTDVINNAQTVLRDSKSTPEARSMAMSSLNTLWDTYAAPWDTDQSFDQAVTRASTLRDILIANGLPAEEATKKLNQVVKDNLQVMVTQSFAGPEPYPGLMFTAVRAKVITPAVYNKWAAANGKAAIDEAKPVPAEEKAAPAEKPKPKTVSRAEANKLREEARQKALAGRGADRGLVEGGGETPEMQRWSLVANPPKYREIKPGVGDYADQLNDEIYNAKTAYEYWKKLEDLGYEDPAYNVAELKKALDELITERESYDASRAARAGNLMDLARGF